MLSDKQFHVEIITPERVRFQGDALSLTVTGVEGQMGLLANHAPILALLQAGRLILQTRERTVNMAVGEGFVKMSDNRAVCLVDFAEQSDEIDRGRAEGKRSELERALGASLTPEKRDELRRQLAAEQARIDVSGS